MPIETSLNAKNPPQKRQLRTLLVDDDALDARIISWVSNKLENYDLEIVHAKNCQEAEKLTRENDFNLFLLDFWLGGESVVQLLRSMPSSAFRHKAIMLSGMDEGGMSEVRALDKDITTLSKDDLNPYELESAITRTIGLEAA